MIDDDGCLGRSSFSPYLRKVPDLDSTRRKHVTVEQASIVSHELNVILELVRVVDKNMDGMGVAQQQLMGFVLAVVVDTIVGKTGATDRSLTD